MAELDKPIMFPEVLEIFIEQKSDGTWAYSTTLEEPNLTEQGQSPFLFGDKGALKKILSRQIQTFVQSLAQTDCLSSPSDKVLEQLIRLTSGIGFTINPYEVVHKPRTIELTLHRGKTRFATIVSDPPHEKLLVYYDRTSGLWAVVS